MDASKQMMAFGIFLNACRDLIEGKLVALHIAPDIFKRVDDAKLWGANGLTRDRGELSWRGIALHVSPRHLKVGVYGSIDWLNEYEADVSASPFLYRKLGGTIEQIDPGWMGVSMASRPIVSELPKEVPEEIDRYITLKRKK